LSVKSRWKTGAEGFIIKNFQCDFVVIAKLNRGSKDGRSKVLPPEFFVLPVEVARAMPRTPGWGKLSFSRVPELEMYRDRWDLIRDFLDVPRSLPPGRTRPDSALEGTQCNRRRARV
jgi:hypothetical protein